MCVGCGGCGGCKGRGPFSEQRNRSHGAELLSTVPRPAATTSTEKYVNDNKKLSFIQDGFDYTGMI